MRTALKSKLIVLLSLLLWVSGCSEVSITGRRQLNFVPSSTMHSMSFDAYDEFLSKNKLSTDAEKTQMVKRVGGRIQRAVENYAVENGIEDQLTGYEWEFNLVEDPNVNAWAMPGGKVVIYTGILPVAQDETGLAVVMGHEIAHAFAKHGAERMSQQLLRQGIGIGLEAAMEDYPQKTKNIFMSAYGVGTQVGFLLPYSRIHESEADHLGLIFMAMAGYDPRQAPAFWERMAAQSKGGATPEFLSTHPSHETRMQDLKDLIPDAMTYYRQNQ
jgi:predicted Zn-dependent protease